MTSGGTGWTQRADGDEEDTSAIHGLPAGKPSTQQQQAPPARTPAAESGPNGQAPSATAAAPATGGGTRGRRKAGAQRDAMSQLRALTDQASDLFRKTERSAGATSATAGDAPSPPATSPAAVAGLRSEPSPSRPVPRVPEPGKTSPSGVAAGAAGATRVGAAAAATARVRDRAPSSAEAQPAPHAPRSARVRKARLRLVRLDPWSVMKVSFLLSIAAGIMLFVAVAVLWSILDAAGVFSTVGDVLTEVTSSEQNSGFDLQSFLSLSRVLGFTTLLAVIDVVLITALATIGAFVYNLAASLLGGLEVTLAEDD